MHELVIAVLDKRDLSKAGELFSVSDWAILSDLHSAFEKLKGIFNSKDYSVNPNSQNVVEICLARITSAIRETGTIESYAPALVDALEHCIQHSLIERNGRKNQESPHAKIASDLLSCLFLHYSKKSVMIVTIPVTVKVLQRGNRDLVRSVSSYLSLAAIHSARLLAQYAHSLIISIISGNYALVRVLAQIYPENKEPFHANISNLIDLIPRFDHSEKLSMLQLGCMIAQNKPELILTQVSKLKSCLIHSNTCGAVVPLFLTLITCGYAAALCDQVASLKKAGDTQGSQNLTTIAKILTSISKTDKAVALDVTSYLVLQCFKGDSHTLVALLREVESVASTFPDVVQSFVPEIVKLTENGSPTLKSIVIRIKEICSGKTSLSTISSRGASSERITIIPINGAISRDQLLSKRSLTSVGERISFVSDSSGNFDSSQSKLSSANATPQQIYRKSVFDPRELDHNFIVGDTVTMRSKLLAPTSIGSEDLEQLPEVMENQSSDHFIKSKMNETPTSLVFRSNLSKGKSKSHGNLSLPRRNHRRPETVNITHVHNVTVGNTAPVSTIEGTANSLLKGTHQILIEGESVVDAKRKTSKAGVFVPPGGPRQGSQGDLLFRNPPPLKTGQSAKLSSTGSPAVSQNSTRDSQTDSTVVLVKDDVRLLDEPLRNKSSVARLETTFIKDQLITMRVGSGTTSPTSPKLNSPKTPPFSPGFSMDPSGNSGDQTRRLRDSSFGSDMQASVDSSSQTPNPSGSADMLMPDQMFFKSPTPRTNKLVSVGTQSTATLRSEFSSVEQVADQRQSGRLGLPVKGDAVKQFCEKHIDKIKTFVHDYRTKYPIPTQCTVEESRNKHRMRIHFVCQEKGCHCLHKTTFFAFKTKVPNLWVHLMFLHLQAIIFPFNMFQSQSNFALSQSQEAVGRLKTCWECLPGAVTKGKSFSALVTAAFPQAKELESILAELQAVRFFDVFAFNGETQRWCCFACNHPERVVNFLNKEGNSPVIEGQLKEKKGRWKFFKRWRTRYFTLSGASLSYKGSLTERSNNPSIDLRSIRTVKSVSSRKGRRSIPKAFEIFTDDDTSYVFKAKDHKNAEEWFQCLQIAVAQAHKESGGDEEISKI